MLQLQKDKKSYISSLWLPPVGLFFSQRFVPFFYFFELLLLFLKYFSIYSDAFRSF